jgi:hypothetical protein
VNSVHVLGNDGPALFAGKLPQLIQLIPIVLLVCRNATV